MPNADPAIARLAALAAALEAVAAATASANPDALAACERQLDAAASNLPTSSELAHEPAATVAAHLQRIRHALGRCRAIGHAVGSVVSVSLSAQGVAHGYRPAGVGGPQPRLGRMEVRV